MNARLTEKFLSLETSTLSISSVTVFELSYGAEKSSWSEKTKQKLALFMAPFTILPFTADDAINAGKIRSYLEKQGKPIGPYAIQIAAQALTRNITLITHNTGEFSRIPDLKLEDWAI